MMKNMRDDRFPMSLDIRSAGCQFFCDTLRGISNEIVKQIYGRLYSLFVIIRLKRGSSKTCSGKTRCNATLFSRLLNKCETHFMLLTIDPKSHTIRFSEVLNKKT